MEQHQRSRRPGTGAWLVLDIFSVAFPCLFLVLMSVVDSSNLDTTFRSLVGYSVVLLIALAVYITTMGTLIFQRDWPGPWELVEGFLLGAILVGSIGVGLHKHFNHGEATPAMQTIAIWLGIQLAILLGVLFYCASLKSWILQQQYVEVARLRNQISDLESRGADSKARSDANVNS